ncbi:MAG: caspase family protein [Hyphomicrobiaceae bacterium]|nr:caspase family protein [Hyphomicrobiaceae bacterium]
MAKLFLHAAGVAIASGLALAAGGAAAQQPAALNDQPVLVLDPGMHTAIINRTDIDRTGQFAVTASDDKTIRLWKMGPKPELVTTIRLPASTGNIGKAYAVAISPDAEVIAAGGWARWTPEDPVDQVYLFNREGKMLKRLGQLASVTDHLAFSHDGRYLAAGLGVGNGIRIFDRNRDWALAAADKDYKGTVYGLDFTADGRLVVSCEDGFIRLYDAAFKLIAKQKTSVGQDPIGIAFSPDGRKIAVGFADARAVALHDGRTLSPLDPPNANGVDNGALATVHWSRDGRSLYSAGRFQMQGRNAVLAWADAGAGPRRALFSGAADNIKSMRVLPNGNLLVASAEPHLAVLTPDGQPQWVQPSPVIDSRAQRSNLSVSVNGAQVDFGYEQGGRSRARFDLSRLALSVGPPSDGMTAPPRQTGLDIKDWVNNVRPTLAGTPLPLSKYESSRSVAIHPKGDSFVLGADWSLRAFDASGKELWRRQVPGIVWAVNISGDGRMVVAAYGDGTIRWHRMDSGRELLAFFPLLDKVSWVAWTPEGFYGATSGAHRILKWHVNRGWDQAAEAIPVSEIKNLRRPEVLGIVLQEMETARAIGLAEMKRAQEEVQLRTRSKVAPGARLHVVSVGVSEYGSNAAHLRLNFAHKDAQDVIAALDNTQSGLYAQVLPQQITNKDATRKNVLDAVKAMRRNMAARTGGSDLAVFHFSGHGALINGKYYLLPHDVDARSTDDITSSAVPINELREVLAEIGQHGRLIVLLDACRSGAASADGTSLGVDGGQLRAALAGLANVTVLTSSDSNKPSFENKAWENGAFTKVFLQALGKAADTDRNGLISVDELMSYMSKQLPQLTTSIGNQSLGMEVRFQSEIFVSGL